MSRKAAELIEEFISEKVVPHDLRAAAKSSHGKLVRKDAESWTFEFADSESTEEFERYLDKYNYSVGSASKKKVTVLVR